MKKRKTFITLFILIAILMLNNSSSAEMTIKDMILEKFSEEGDICLVIKSLIQEGKSAKEVTKTSIDMGYNTCLVVKCATEGGGNPEEIIIGANLAGIPPEVISRCAIDAGLEPKGIGLPGGDKGGGFLSPSSF